MSREFKYLIFSVTILLRGLLTAAQQPGDVTPVTDSTSSHQAVAEIHISGNKKTKAAIILREIPFKTGDEFSLEELVNKMDQARRQLMNTALFSSAIVAAGKVDGDRVNITANVKERWYLFPLPYFRPVDRNVNQWLFEKGGSLDRVNYGVKITYNNATGRNDKFRLWLVNGYTKQLSFSYDRLYFDKQLRWGIKLAFATGKNREVNYNTIDDKQVFIKDENNFIRHFTNATVELTYRPAIKTRHSFGIGYTYERVGDTILELNPGFFPAGRNSVRYPGINYTLNYLDLDFNPYPTKGYAAQLSIGKTGFNSSIDIWQLHGKGLGVWPVNRCSFFSLNIYGGVKLPFKQPYFNQRLLGYGDMYMQGFEYYVIDGVAGGYVKTTYTRELLKFFVKLPAGKNGKERERIPFRIFGKIFGNTGYVHNPKPGENSLSNKMLYSGGIGIDILSFYDVTFKLEWAVNSLGENGLFLHRKTIF